jgi:hypothetical protein
VSNGHCTIGLAERSALNEAAGHHSGALGMYPFTSPPIAGVARGIGLAL